MRYNNLFIKIFPVLLFLQSVSLAAIKDQHAEEVFKQYANSVIRVKILEKSSQSQASVGSGFFVGADGIALTNYHVVYKLIWYPDDYRAEVILSNGDVRPFIILDIDVVHDLALVKVEDANYPFLFLTEELPLKGIRLFAMGNPYDLGLTIVEGTYSGLLEQTFLPRLHFTGSINPGMSGGPVIDRNGKVIGVSVATAGNQVSFLVPASFGNLLLKSKTNASDIKKLKKRISAQLMAYQENVVSLLAAQPVVTQSLGAFVVPGRLHPAFQCWAKTNESQKQPYHAIRSKCFIDDGIFINDKFSTGKIQIVHDELEASLLNSFQFSSLLRFFFSETVKNDSTLNNVFNSHETDVTPYESSSSLIKINDITLKTVSRVRAYKEFPGLYDICWRAVSIVDKHRGFVTSLDLEGVTCENGEKFLKHYIDGFSWNKK